MLSVTVTSPLRALVDSNLLLRGAQPTHPQFPVADAAVAKLRLRGETVHACPQNVAEFWAVSTRPISANGLGFTTARADAELFRILSLFPLLDDIPAIFPIWRRLVVGAGVSGKQTHDARLMAVALAHGVTRLLTVNVTDFTCYAALAPTVQSVDPNTV